MKKDTILCCNPALRLRFSRQGGVEAIFDNTKFLLGRHALAVIDAFSKPIRFDEGFEQIMNQAQGLREVALTLTQSIFHMINIGVLIQVQSDETLPRKVENRERRVPSLQPMVPFLNHSQRILAYLDAIRQVVKPGDVVVEVESGAAMGLLSIAAVWAGAERVYTIQRSNTHEITEIMVNANHAADRIQFIRDWSEQSELPEAVDVVITGILPSNVYFAPTFEIVNAIASRYTHAGTRFIPTAMNVCAQPVSIPKDYLDTYLFTEQNTAEWSEWYGIDFSILSELSKTSPQAVATKRKEAATWEKMSSQAVRLAHCDLNQSDKSNFIGTVDIAVDQAGEVNGLVLFNEIDFDGVLYSNEPGIEQHDNQQANTTFIYGTPLQVEAGQIISIQYELTRELLDISIESPSPENQHA